MLVVTCPSCGKQVVSLPDGKCPKCDGDLPEWSEPAADPTQEHATASPEIETHVLPLHPHPPGGEVPVDRHMSYQWVGCAALAGFCVGLLSTHLLSAEQGWKFERASFFNGIAGAVAGSVLMLVTLAVERSAAESRSSRANFVRVAVGTFKMLSALVALVEIGTAIVIKFTLGG